MDFTCRRNWERRKNEVDEMPSYEDSINFLSYRLKMLTATETSRIIPREKRPQDSRVISKGTESNNFYQNKPHCFHLASINAVQARIECGICGGFHSVSKCWNIKSINSHERRLLARPHNLCFNCLSKGHKCPANGVVVSAKVDITLCCMQKNVKH